MEMLSSSAKRPISIGEVDEAMLQAFNRLHYLTASQVTRLFYPLCRDENRYSQRRLRRLVEGGYLLRLRALPAPRVGSAPHVFTLGDKGRRFLTAAGVRLVSQYFRPSEEQAKAWNRPFMLHTLATVDILIHAALLTKQYKVSMPRLMTERQLRKKPVRVNPPGQEKRQVAVIPDSWFQLQPAGGPAISISLELDRGTEDQQAWRDKVAALAAWAAGPYRDAFKTDNLTVAVATPDEHRRDALRMWTSRELAEIGMPQLADLFLFTGRSPLTTPVGEFFFGAVWYPAGEAPASGLLDNAQQVAAPMLASP